jgi:toxin ParE1/3/4
MGVARPDIAADARCLPYQDYLILYRVSARGIEIVRVVHGAQRLQELF